EVVDGARLRCGELRQNEALRAADSGALLDGARGGTERSHDSPERIHDDGRVRASNASASSASGAARSSLGHGSDGELRVGPRVTALTAFRRLALRPARPAERPAPASRTLAHPVVVGFEHQLAERALDAPATESRHEDGAVELVRDPSADGLAVGP